MDDSNGDAHIDLFDELNFELVEMVNNTYYVDIDYDGFKRDNCTEFTDSNGNDWLILNQ
jgi:hypothetical protein